MRQRYSGDFPRGKLSDEEPTPKYFVPTFSISRKVSLDDGVSLEMQRKLRKSLGRHYDARPPTTLGLTIVNQRKFIERLREGRIKPTAGEIRDLAYATRDELAEVLKDKPTKLKVPLRNTVAVFGDRNNQLGLQVLGWKGYSGRYAAEDAAGEALPLSIIATENKLVIGSISAAMAHRKSFVVDGLARTPHITLASHKGRIRDHELRAINEKVGGELPVELTLDDPIIYLRAERQGPVEPIYVRTPTNEPLPGAA